MGIFDGISEASISSGGLKLRDGHRYTLEILSCTVKNGYFGQTFIAETVVHETDDPERPVGCRPSWTCNMKHANAKGNVLVFIGAACGIDPKNEAELRRQVNDKVAEHVVSPHNPLAGKFVKCFVEEIETKAKYDFLKHYFDPCSQTFPSRANDAPVLVAGQSAPTAAPSSLPSMPGAFVPPAAPFAPAAPPALPGLFGGAPPPIPATPPPIPAAAPPPIFPPAGWAKHPDAPGYFWKGTEAITEADLRARVAAGKA